MLATCVRYARNADIMSTFSKPLSFSFATFVLAFKANLKLYGFKKRKQLEISLKNGSSQ